MLAGRASLTDIFKLIGIQMIVNISRNKLLINKNRVSSRLVKPKKPQPRCNHCGGLVRVDNELSACVMCSREIDHVCDTCSYATLEEIAKNKKTA